MPERHRLVLFALAIGVIAQSIGIVAWIRDRDNGASATRDLTTYVEKLYDAVVHPQLRTPQPSGQIRYIRFFDGFDAETQSVIRDKLIPAMQQAYGPPWQDIDLQFYTEAGLLGVTNTVECSHPVALMSVNVGDTQGWNALLHELMHVWQGCYGAAFNANMKTDPRFTEGMANCGAKQILSSLNLPYSGSDPTASQLGDIADQAVNNRAGIGGGYRFKYVSTSGNLQAFREVIGGQAFCEFESAHNGFMAGLRNAWYAELYRGVPEAEIDLVALGEKVTPGFSDWFVSQPIFADRPAGNQVLIAALHHTVWIFPIQRDDGHNESPLTGVTVEYTYTQNGVVYAHDSVVIQEGKDTLETDFLKSDPQPQFGVPMTISVTMGDLHDELTYTPTAT